MPAIDRCCSYFPPTSYILYLQPSLSCFWLSWPLAILCSYRWQLCRQEHIRRGFILLEALAACRGTSHATWKPPVPLIEERKADDTQRQPSFVLLISQLSISLLLFFQHVLELFFSVSPTDMRQFNSSNASTRRTFSPDYAWRCFAIFLHISRQLVASNGCYF